MKRFIKKQKPEFYLFIGSFFFLMILGFLLNYNYKLFENYNLLFDFDTGRIMLDATVMNASHYRLDVHPLFILIVQPIVFILQGIVVNRIIAIIALSAFVSSLTIVFIYKILKYVGLSEKMSIILSLVYLFSFSNIIVTAGIETYNFAALFLVLLWYYFITRQKELDNKSYFILGILGLLSLAITVTNFVIFLIVCFNLWIFRKVKLHKLLCMGVLIIVSLIVLNIGQRVIWNNTPVLWNINVGDEVGNFANRTIGWINAKRVLEGDYMHSLISSNIYVKVMYASEYNDQNFTINFYEPSLFLKGLFLLFYALILWIVIRNYKKNIMINFSLILSLVFNSLFHLIYGNSTPFLYALHFLYLVILLLGINLSTEKDKRIQKTAYIFSGVIIGIEVLQNSRIFIKVLQIADQIINKNYLLANIPYPLFVIIELLVVAVTIIMVVILIQMIAKIVKEKNPEKKAILGVLILCLLVMTELMYIALESPKDTNRFLGFHLKGNSGVVERKRKEDYTNNEFKKRFKKELKALDDYQKEYNEFKNTHKVEEIKDVNWFDYYYFGMGNRKKYSYQFSNLRGIIIDEEKRKTIYQFDELDHYLIPNLYMVIIETKDHQFHVIQETEEGVFLDGKLLEGTGIPIKFYDFSNQKYANMKKVLYGEILFNIKDSAIYPNIIVYDNPWYRDAAITTMVLKQTHNTDMIYDWVMRIDDIYDRQNSGVEEADNLGELLYILSSQEEKRTDLIERIEQEAYRLAEENPDGYYIYGKTDFGEQYLYQNLWYKLGIESLGKEYPFDLESIKEDSYSKMAWWSNYELKDTSQNPIELQYPYLSYAYYHKLGTGQIPVNRNLYPLSWEMNASAANYEKYEETLPGLNRAKASSLHSWSASELLLLLLDETGDLDFK